jgi:hypothetical protein
MRLDVMNIVNTSQKNNSMKKISRHKLVFLYYFNLMNCLEKK